MSTIQHLQHRYDRIKDGLVGDSDDHLRWILAAIEDSALSNDDLEQLELRYGISGLDYSGLEMGGFVW